MIVEGAPGAPQIEQVLEQLDPTGSGVYDQASSTDPLDTPEAHTLLNRVRDWRAEEIRRQKVNRRMMAIDHDFYDGIQWQQDHAAELEARGQAPLTYNRVQLSVDFLHGTYIRTRTDWQILGRNQDDEDAAKIKTQSFKFVSDVNLLPYKQSSVVRDAIKGGVGYIEFGVNTDPTEELIFGRWESWRNVWIDSRSRSPDYNEDARYIIRDKWLDSDVARQMWWERRDLIARSTKRGVKDEGREWNEEIDEDGDFEQMYRYVQANSWNDVQNLRARVLVSECWYKVPRRMQYLKGGPLNGEQYDKTSTLHQVAVKTGDSRVVTSMCWEMRYIFWCSAGILEQGVSPYKHRMFPLQPLFFRRRDRDNLPYGQIRGSRDAQEDLNQRMSRALWRSSTRRLEYEAETFEDEDEVLDQIARPDAKIKVKKGRLAAYKITTDVGLMESDINLMHLDAAHIEYGSGITNEALGRETNATSGKAVRARQDQVSITAAPFFDNQALWFKNCGSIILSLIEQYWTEERTIRITDERQSPQYVKLNTYKWDDQSGTWGVENDVTAAAADFVVAARDYRDSVREAMFESFMDLIAKMPPNIAMQLLDIAIEMHPDVPNKKLVLSRIRRITGVDDPEGVLTPEELAAKQRDQQMQQHAQDVQMQTLDANLAKLQAETQKAASEGRRVDAQSVRETVTAIYEALQGGQIIATIPQVTPAADQILQGAGFSDAGGQSLATNDDPALQAIAAAVGTNVPKTLPSIPGTVPTAPDPRQAAGAMQGIETVRNDGAQPTG